MLNEATKANLRRKSYYVDAVQMIDGEPLFSWIDINPTELCNRRCVFCPRIDPDDYPNQPLHLSLDLAAKIARELGDLDYRGAVVLSGFGEPTLHPQFDDLVAILGPACRLELVTNGDTLSPNTVRSLVGAGLDYFVVSVYDGPHQLPHFRQMFAEAGCGEEYFILRDRWHTAEDGFGLKLTNRAGTVTVGQQDPVCERKPCHYPAYSMTLDWNGDVLLCVQDWNKRVKLGNVYAQSLLDIWRSKAMRKWRQRLIDGNRTIAPCNKCNADGTLHGYNHVAKWTETAPASRTGARTAVADGADVDRV